MHCTHTGKTNASNNKSRWTPTAGSFMVIVLNFLHNLIWGKNIVTIFHPQVEKHVFQKGREVCFLLNPSNGANSMTGGRPVSMVTPLLEAINDALSVVVCESFGEHL